MSAGRLSHSAANAITASFPLFREEHALRPSPAFSAARCIAASEARKAAEKHFYIDAFRDKNDTRETLLRYTFKSHSVNVLIGGYLWISQAPWIGEGRTVKLLGRGANSP